MELHAMMQMGLMLLVGVIVANSLQDKCPEGTHDHLLSQLLPLQESLQQKDGYLSGLDDVISDLQRKLHELKENDDQDDQELLVDMKSKVEEKEAKVVELETILVKKSKELLNLRGQVQTLQSSVEGQELEIKQVADLETVLAKKSRELLNLRGQVQTLQSNVESQELEIKQLEICSSSQSKQLDEVQEALYLVEESVRKAQARGDEQEIYKVNTEWLPQWAVKHLVYWQVKFAAITGSSRTLLMHAYSSCHSRVQSVLDKWSFTLKDGWEKAVHVVGAHARVYESKGLKRLEVLQKGVLIYLQEAQKICKKKIEAAWELSREYMDGPGSLDPYVTQMKSVLQPYASKLRQYYDKTLRYGIKHHLQLQRKVRSTLQKNRYLVSIMSKEVVWLLASAMLVVPLYGILLLFSSVFGKKRGSQLARSETSQRGKEVRHAHR